MTTHILPDDRTPLPMEMRPRLPTPANVGARAVRRYDLDWLRVFAFGMLILYHVGMFYVTWPWHVKSPSASSFAEPAMLTVNPWRLALLFFISGVAIHFVTDKTPLKTFLPNRFLRLFVPVVFGMLVVVMPQAYLELRFKGEVGPGLWAFLSFYADYVTFTQNYSIIVPTWNHLWYVVYILAYTLLLAPFLPLLRRFAEGTGDRALAWLEARPAFWLLILPTLPFLVYRAFLDPIFPTTHTLIDDWANHAHSLTMLLFGYVAAKSPAFWRAVDRTLPVAATVAISLCALLLIARLNASTLQEIEGVVMAVRLTRIVYAWAVIVTLLGLAQRFLNRPSGTLSYLTEAIFPFYILHQTMTIIVGYWLIPYQLPAALEATIVVAGTALGCVVGYEIIRRVQLLRPLFGLARQGKPKPVRATPAAGAVAV